MARVQHAPYPQIPHTTRRSMGTDGEAERLRETSGACRGAFGEELGIQGWAAKVTEICPRSHSVKRRQLRAPGEGDARYWRVGFDFFFC